MWCWAFRLSACFLITFLERRKSYEYQFNQLSHIITDQFAAEEAMLRECRQKQYSVNDPYVKVNPYAVAPLTALVHFVTPQPETVAVTVKGKEKAGDLHWAFPAALEHFLPLYGLYAGETTEVMLDLGSGTQKTLHITTEQMPDKLVKPTRLETTAAYLGDNMMFVTPTSPAMAAAYDYRGDARWYCTLNLAFDLKRARNGRLLVGTHRLVLPPYHTSGVFEMGMIGKIYKEYRLPGGYHHDQIEMEDGNLLILTQDPPRGTVEDMCVLVDRKTGALLKTWDYQKALPQDVGGSGSQDTTGSTTTRLVRQENKFADPFRSASGRRHQH